MDRTTVTLRNTVTDPDGDQSDLTFDVWTVNADGSPKAHLDTDKNQYGMPVSGYVKSGEKASVAIDYGYLHPGWTYAFRTSAYDGSLYEQTWSPWATFTIRDHAVDITLPEPDKNAPDVDLAQYQEPLKVAQPCSRIVTTPSANIRKSLARVGDLPNLVTRCDRYSGTHINRTEACVGGFTYEVEGVVVKDGKPTGEVLNATWAIGEQYKLDPQSTLI
ncbi:hypothetical protein AB0L75_24990 [Streptomyces sp. NPDC052101]|uniref:hypothetical protein n=1 Tax=Streptomyces sp. NPDC052101 TaxID=3155763 RepID=UPI003444FC76